MKQYAMGRELVTIQYYLQMFQDKKRWQIKNQKWKQYREFFKKVYLSSLKDFTLTLYWSSRIKKINLLICKSYKSETTILCDM